MDSNKYIEEGLDEYCYSHYELSQNLSKIFNIDEMSLFSFVTYLNPKSILFKKITQIAAYIGKKTDRRSHTIGRKAIIKEEEKETDRVIGSMTASFIPEIKLYFETEEISLTNNQLENIDNFLYLINSNYFAEIYKRNEEARREFLVEQLLYLITSYLRTSNKKTFDERDAKKILDTCIFIPEDLKQEIISEFKHSRSCLSIFPKYQIVRKDISGGKDSYIQAKMHSNKNRIQEWDNTSQRKYILLIEALEESEDFLEQDLGSAKDLSWEVSFLQKMAQLADTKYRHELIKISDDYSNFGFTYALIYNAMVYSVAYEIEDVTSYVIIDSFAECYDLPFDLKLRMIDDIFEQEKLDYKYHPYRTRKKESKVYSKNIIPFKTKAPNSH